MLSKPILGVLTMSFAAMLSACASTSTEQANVATEQQVAAVDGAEAPALDPVKCKTITPIGTKIGQRVCYKQSEWDEIEGAGKETTREIQRRANTVGNPSGQ
ncbi:MAG: hypothetical protein AAGG55_14385 [Pseudomonadota bacterium]